MLVAVRTLFQRLEELGAGWRTRQGLRQSVEALGLAGGGFIASAASLRGIPQPIAMGLILRFGSWRSLCVCLGAMAGYRAFWGNAGEMAMWWTLGAGLLALLSLPREMLPTLGMLTVGAVGVFLSRDREILPFLLRLGVAGGSIHISQRRDRTGRWLQCSLASLALAQVAPRSWLGLGFTACGMLAVGGSFPAAALTGLGLDLAGVTALPMTAVAAAGWMGKLLPRGKRFRWCFPGAAALAVMLCLGVKDWKVLPGLVAGGALGLLLPPVPQATPNRGETGPAQVRLEMAAGAMEQLRKDLLARKAPPPDRHALLQRLRSRACGSCPVRNSCLEQERLTATVLEDTRPFPCRRPGRLRPELAWARDRLRLMGADRRRREEYRLALAGEYRSCAAMLRQLSEELPRRQERKRIRYGVTAALRTRGKGPENGDRWASFPGTRGRYFVLLCDGMGTGPGAGEEGARATKLLRQLLAADFSPADALGSLNAQLTLGGRAGAVTVDLAELRLDTGEAVLYKWGAAPSWRVKDGKAEKIGTATPPPGLSVGSGGLWKGRLSLRGEGLLIMLSDGVDGEEVPRRVALAEDAAPGDLAERLLEGEREDDATAAVIRLYPAPGRGALP